MSDYADELLKFPPSRTELKEFARSASSNRLISAFERPLIWRGLLGQVFRDDSCTALLASAHCKILECWALIPFGLENSAYSNLRGIYDSLVAFSYYAHHPVEWAAVVRETAWWISRADALEQHSRYTRGFRDAARKLGLLERLDKHYSLLSKYVHGIPPEGIGGLTEFTRNPPTADSLLKFFTIAEAMVDDINLLYILVFHAHMVELSADEYKKLLRGIAVKDLAVHGIVLSKPV